MGVMKLRIRLRDTDPSSSVAEPGLSHLPQRIPRVDTDAFRRLWVRGSGRQVQPRSHLESLGIRHLRVVCDQDQPILALTQISRCKPPKSVTRLNADSLIPANFVPACDLFVGNCITSVLYSCPGNIGRNWRNTTAHRRSRRVRVAQQRGASFLL